MANYYLHSIPDPDSVLRPRTLKRQLRTPAGALALLVLLGTRQGIGNVEAWVALLGLLLVHGTRVAALARPATARTARRLCAAARESAPNGRPKMPDARVYDKRP